MAAILENQAKTVVTTLSPKYVERWSRREALREIVQNALDASQGDTAAVTFAYADGRATISDAGPGIALRHLAMGLSEKGPDSIGQFGEGLKLALLVYAREGNDCRVYSNGHVITPRIMHHPDLQTDVLAFDIEANPEHRQGVTVVAECAQADLAWAQSRFLALAPPKHVFTVPTTVTPLSVALPGGKVYINGQLVDEGDYKLTWHLTDRTAINRDRTILSTDAFEQAVREACRSLTDPVLAREFVVMAVEERTSPWRELAVGWWSAWKKVHFKHPAAWERAIADLYGKRVCISCPGQTATNGQAEYEGWSVITPHSNWASLLQVFLPDALEATQGKAAYNVTPAYSMDSRRVAVLTEATRRVAKVLKCFDATLHGKVQVVDNLQKDGRRVQGLYDGGMIFLDRDRLYFEHDAVSTLVHECAHMLTNGAEDLSRPFCECLQAMLTALLLKGR